MTNRPQLVHSTSDGIKTDIDPVPSWVHVIPRQDGKLPTTEDGRRWQWLRLDTITKIYAEVALSGIDVGDHQYQIVVVASGEQYHPTKLLLDGNESGMAEFKLMGLVNAALRKAAVPASP